MATLTPSRLANSFRKTGAGLKRRLLAFPPIELVWRTVLQFLEDDGTHLAAGVAYYGMLSIFPLILGTMAIAAYFLDQAQVERLVFESLQTVAPASSDLLESNIRNIRRLRGALGIASVLGLIWTASAMFGAMSKAVNRAWNVKEDRPFYISKPRHLAMALIAGALFLLSTVITVSRVYFMRAGQAISDFIPVLAMPVFVGLTGLLTFLIAFMIFYLIYRFIPNTQTRWGDVWLGALVAAVLFEIGRNVFVFYLNNFGNYTQIYGSLASVIVLMVWIFLSALILIIGAELASEYTRMKRGLARGVPLDTRAPQ